MLKVVWCDGATVGHWTQQNFAILQSEVLYPDGPSRGTGLVSVALGQKPAYTTRPWLRGQCISCVPVYFPAFTGTHCACP